MRVGNGDAGFRLGLRVQIAVLLGLVLLAYANSLSNGFTLDMSCI